MGMSSDAILFYGIVLKGEDGDCEGFEPTWKRDWEDEYGHRMGIADKDWEQKNKKVNECPCNIEGFCHTEFLMWNVHIKEAHYRAWRGFTVDIPAVLSTPKQQNKWNEEIQAFCDLMGLKYEEPKWWLVSYMG